MLRLTLSLILLISFNSILKAQDTLTVRRGRNVDSVKIVANSKPFYLIEPFVDSSYSKNHTYSTYAVDHKRLLRFNNKPIIVDINNKHEINISNQNSHKANATINITGWPHVWLTGNFGKLYIINHNMIFNKYFFDKVEVDSLTLVEPGTSHQFVDSKIKRLTFLGLFNSPRVSFYDTKLDTLNFRLDNNRLPDTLIFSNVNLSSAPILDLTKSGKLLILYLGSTDIDKFKIDIARTNVIVLKKQPYIDKYLLYQRLKKMTSEKGLFDKYEVYDKQFRELIYLSKNEWLKNFFDKYWWDYGYDKSRVIYISIGFYLLFSLINLTFSKELKKVYWPDKFQTYESRVDERYQEIQITRTLKIKRRSQHGMGVFLLTAYVFWGVKLDLKDIELRNRWMILLLISQYIVGIICLAYIANFIVSK